MIDLLGLDLLVGSGGVLSHAPRRIQSVLMMLDAFLPEGVTQLAVDSIFMMPQLGVLAEVNERAATDVFVADCLIRLGTAVAPIGKGKEGQTALKATIQLPSGAQHVEVPFGSMVRLPLAVGETANATFEPQGKLDLGSGPGSRSRRSSSVASEGSSSIVVVAARSRFRPIRRAGSGSSPSGPTRSRSTRRSTRPRRPSVARRPLDADIVSGAARRAHS